MQLVLVDTPGVMISQRNPLEGRMMSYVRGSMREADAVVAIVDASQVSCPLLSINCNPCGANYYLHKNDVTYLQLSVMMSFGMCNRAAWDKPYFTKPRFEIYSVWAKLAQTH